MKNKVELPLVEPIYSTFHTQIATATIHSNPTLRNWYLNEVMNLKCNRKFLSGFSTPSIFVQKSSLYETACYEKRMFALDFIDGYINYVIRNLLDNGFYIYFNGLDDYFLEGKTWYNQRHFNHDGVICGYDKEKKTYTVYAYDINWILRKFEVSQKSFDKSRKYIIKNNKRGHILGFKPKDELLEFNLQLTLQNLTKYSNSTMEKYPVDGEGDVFGIIVHNYIAMYIDKLIDGSIPHEKMDWRIYRLIWEHKKFMLERLLKIEDVLNLDSKASDEYKKIVNEADRIRMLYASHHMHRRDSLLPIIKEKTLHIMNTEKKILTELITKANEVIEK